MFSFSFPDYSNQTFPYKITLFYNRTKLIRVGLSLFKKIKIHIIIFLTKNYITQANRLSNKTPNRQELTSYQKLKIRPGNNNDSLAKQ